MSAPTLPTLRIPKEQAVQVFSQATITFSDDIRANGLSYLRVCSPYIIGVYLIDLYHEERESKNLGSVEHSLI